MYLRIEYRFFSNLLSCLPFTNAIPIYFSSVLKCKGNFSPLKLSSAWPLVYVECGIPLCCKICHYVTPDGHTHTGNQLTMHELVLLKVRTRGSQFTRSIAHARKYNVFMFSNVSCQVLNVHVTSAHSIIINNCKIRLLCSSKMFFKLDTTCIIIHF